MFLPNIWTLPQLYKIDSYMYVVILSAFSSQVPWYPVCKVAVLIYEFLGYH